MIVVLDNRDSYTFNLVQLLRQLTRREIRVVGADDGNEALRLVRSGVVAGVVISPGPGHPDNDEDFAASGALIDWIVQHTEIPLLGVCLGHQGLAQRFGYRVVPAPEAKHGWVSTLTHNGTGLFTGVTHDACVTRYHSLVIERGEHPDPNLRITATSEDGVIQAFAIEGKPWFGVQFHPESVASSDGAHLLQNFLDVVDPPTVLSVETFPLPGSRFDACRAIYRHTFDGHRFWLESDDWSILGDATEVTAADFDDLKPGFGRVIGGEELPFRGGAVGWFGYEYGLRALGVDAPDSQLPESQWMWPHRFVVINDRTISVCGGRSFTTEVKEALQQKLPTLPRFDPEVPEIGGDWRDERDTYLDKIAECQRALVRGDSYELCLTNTFTVQPCEIEPVELFELLQAHHPTPYAALIESDVTVVSASPERFLLGRGGTYSTKPIKGTAARGSTPDADHRIAQLLKSDPKTIAENLMIVDLLRNDLGRVCTPGSVRVTESMAVETYASVHQLVSTVEGESAAPASEVARALFPGGSMTGAPKLRSVEILADLERAPRGVYSGVLGFFGADGNVDLSIVIRTAVLSGGVWTIGAGGAIVLDSDAEAEADEVELKASFLRRAIAQVAH